MDQRTELDEVCLHLEDLTARVVSGRHAGLAECAGASLASCRSALESLARQVRAGQYPAGSREACLAIRRRLAHLRALLDHAEQIRAGLTGVVALLYEENTGSRYSPRGESRLAALPRIQAEA